MAVMSESQQQLLDELEQAGVDFTNFEEALRKEVADRKWEAKANLRRLVREARGEGVPMRKIGFALGTSDHKTLKDYENDVRRDK